MKICPECHRISKDDDFCSHCGSAVYGREDYSSDSLIDCSKYDNHSHEKVSFSEQDMRSSAADTYRGRDFTNYPDEKPKKKKSGCAVLILFIIGVNLLRILMGFLTEIFD